MPGREKNNSLAIINDFLTIRSLQLSRNFPFFPACLALLHLTLSLARTESKRKSQQIIYCKYWFNKLLILLNGFVGSARSGTATSLAVAKLRFCFRDFSPTTMKTLITKHSIGSNKFFWRQNEIVKTHSIPNESKPDNERLSISIARLRLSLITLASGGGGVQKCRMITSTELCFCFRRCLSHTAISSVFASCLVHALWWVTRYLRWTTH